MISEWFIRRPVATTLLTLGLMLAGIVALVLLPVAPLPQVDFPTIAVQATLPGASPETMAASVATPLERSLGRIADVTEMTSTSTLGATRVILQFELGRDVDGAARDVEAAIIAARTLMPTGMPGNPTYRKVNPADSPVVILSLHSAVLTRGQLYDAASTIVAQRLSQIDGVGQVTVGGSSLPAVRAELDPRIMSAYGISLETVRGALAKTNVALPKGAVEDGPLRWQIGANDQLHHAADYAPVIVAWHNGAAVRLSDLGTVVDSVEDLHNAGLDGNEPAVLVMVNKQPGANIVTTVERVKALLPELRASLPALLELTSAMDRTPLIRVALHDVERTLAISVLLVILVVLVFLRDRRATLIPAITIPVSLIGTCAVMYLCGYSLDNLSLMALAVATGFVVDDAIVVVEDIARHIELGVPRFEAALRGAREVGITVLSMSLSLIAVFIPILLMGGIVGRFFREFAVTLSSAIVISLVLSLTTTPMLCARWLGHSTAARSGWFSRVSEESFAALLRGYARSLDWVLEHGRSVLLVLIATVICNVYLYATVPKGFFPQQDTGRLMGMIQADQSISFAAMQRKLEEFVAVTQRDPAVERVVAFAGGGGPRGSANSGSLFVMLKPRAVRGVDTDQVMARLRKQLTRVAGAVMFLQPVQDVRAGGRSAGGLYQYTLQSDTLDDLRKWVPRITLALQRRPELADVNTDQQDSGRQIAVTVDRDSSMRFGISAALIDSALNDAFAQRQVATLHDPLNQYHVVMEVAPAEAQSPTTLANTYISVPPSTQNPTGAQVPLSTFARFAPSNAPVAVNHQGPFVASTISFNLLAGGSLSNATAVIADTMDHLGVPSSIHGTFQGTAKVFQESLKSQPLLILAALVTIYIILGVLYESFIHPLTILSTLPSAGVGALLALELTHTNFDVMALIGVILLIGVVKKNAILIIDFALIAERQHGLPPLAAIREACVLRFRPIMMTTLAALLGALPLALGSTEGAELRRPLGIAVVGGLLLSQILTLYTTPIVYLYLDRLRGWRLRVFKRTQPLVPSAPATLLQ